MNDLTSLRFALLITFFGGGFLMHLIWEMAQMPLFESGGESLWDTFTMCLFATATGDMLFMLTIYLIVAVIHKEFWWLSDNAAYSHPATWVVPAVVGVLMAVSFELWAVHAVSRWTYGSMPLIPLVSVGITPVLQMIVIPLAAIAGCRWWVSR